MKLQTCHSKFTFYKTVISEGEPPLDKNAAEGQANLGS
jgi:hypothetical protein